MKEAERAKKKLPANRKKHGKNVMYMFLGIKMGEVAVEVGPVDLQRMLSHVTSLRTEAGLADAQGLPDSGCCDLVPVGSRLNEGLDRT